MTGHSVGFCSLSALDRPLAAAAAAARAAGCDGLEVTARPPHLNPGAGTDAARRAGRAVRDEGLEVLAYGSYLGRFGEVGDDVPAREVALASAMGAPLLRVWAEPLPGGLEPVASLLRRTGDLARKEGITVVVERHGGSLADTPERIGQLLGAIDRPNVALNYQPMDALPADQAALQPEDAALLAPLSRYVHLKNYRANPEPGGPLLHGGSLEHGVLDVAAMMRAVLVAGYAGPFSVEFLAFDARPVEEKLASDVAFVRRVLEETR